MQIPLAFRAPLAVYWKANGGVKMAIAYQDIVLLNAELRARGLRYRVS